MSSRHKKRRRAREEERIDLLLGQPCHHHWIIPPADGPTSTGVCAKCGAEKTFHNFGEATYSEYHSLKQTHGAYGLPAHAFVNEVDW